MADASDPPAVDQQLRDLDIAKEDEPNGEPKGEAQDEGKDEGKDEEMNEEKNQEKNEEENEEKAEDKEVPTASDIPQDSVQGDDVEAKPTSQYSLNSKELKCA